MTERHNDDGSSAVDEKQQAITNERRSSPASSPPPHSEPVLLEKSISAENPPLASPDRLAAAEANASAKVKSPIARGWHALARKLSQEEGDDKGHYSNSPAAERCELNLLSTGAPRVYVDIIAIKDYHDDSATAWTSTVERLKRRTKDKYHIDKTADRHSVPYQPVSVDKEYRSPQESRRDFRVDQDQVRVREVKNVIPQIQTDDQVNEEVLKGSTSTVNQGLDRRNHGTSSSRAKPGLLQPTPTLGAIAEDTQEIGKTNTNELPTFTQALRPIESPSQIPEPPKTATASHDVVQPPSSLPNVARNTASDRHENVNWLSHKTMLPRMIPESRIFALEYGQHPASDPSPPTIRGLVQNFFRQILRIRENSEGRPLIFITHGFGFVILLEMLFSRHLHTRQRERLQQSLAAVFVLVTPEKENSNKLTTLKSIDYPRDIYRRVLGFSDSLPYLETRDSKYVNVHREHFEYFRCLRPQRSARKFFRVFENDGKTFRIPSDGAFIQLINLLKSTFQSYLLIDAATNGKRDLLETYEDAGWDFKLTDSAGRSALHFAVLSNRPDILRFLLQCDGISVDGKDTYGRTALHYAVRTLSGPQNAIAMLVDHGADATIKDKDETSVLEIAAKRGIQQSSLKTFRAITGPRSDPDIVLNFPKRSALSDLQKLATEDCLMTVAEFFMVDDDDDVPTEKFILQRPSVFEALYGTFPDDILEAARRRTDMTKTTRVCKWFHLPHNHAGWIDGLFARLGLAQKSIQLDQHNGKTQWSNYLRPHCRNFKAVRLPLPSKQGMRERSPIDDTFPESKHQELEGTLMYMPFLASERHCDQRLLYDTIVESPSHYSRVHRYLLGTHQIGVPEPPEEASVISLEPDALSISTARSTEEIVPTEVDASAVSPDILNLEAAEISDAESHPDFGGLADDATQSGGRLRSENRLLYAYKDVQGKPLHIRRTLDQSHYLMLNDTTKRDRDQVVLRRQQSGSESRTYPYNSTQAHKEDLKDPRPMVMVDQLWLWVLGDTVISSFPQSWTRSHSNGYCDVLERLVAYINATKQRGPIDSSHEFAKLIIKHCVDVFNHSEQEKHFHQLSLHDEFESSVGIVAEAEVRLFRRFGDQVFQLKETRPSRQGQKLKTSGKSHTTSSIDSDSDVLQQVRRIHKKLKKSDPLEMENEILDKLFDIKGEIDLLDEAKDIRDELRIIIKTLLDQERVIGEFLENLASAPRASNKVKPDKRQERHLSAPSIATSLLIEKPSTENLPASNASHEDISDSAYVTVQSNLNDFKRMLDHVTATEKGINQLLNLKQKEANALEARFARKSAQAATKQGNTILFFTIVTIIFGSLSFITAFFTLNVTAFPLDEGNGEPQWALKHIIGLIAGFSLSLSIPFVVMALTINPVMIFFKRIGRKLRNTIRFLCMLVVWAAMVHLTGGFLTSILVATSKKKPGTTAKAEKDNSETYYDYDYTDSTVSSVVPLSEEDGPPRFRRRRSTRSLDGVRFRVDDHEERRPKAGNFWGNKLVNVFKRRRVASRSRRISRKMERDTGYDVSDFSDPEHRRSRGRIKSRSGSRRGHYV